MSTTKTLKKRDLTTIEGWMMIFVWGCAIGTVAYIFVEFVRTFGIITTTQGLFAFGVAIAFVYCVNRLCNIPFIEEEVTIDRFSEIAEVRSMGGLQGIRDRVLNQENAIDALNMIITEKSSEIHHLKDTMANLFKTVEKREDTITRMLAYENDQGHLICDMFEVLGGDNVGLTLNQIDEIRKIAARMKVNVVRNKS